MLRYTLALPMPCAMPTMNTRTVNSVTPTAIFRLKSPLIPCTTRVVGG